MNVWRNGRRGFHNKPLVLVLFLFCCSAGNLQAQQAVPPRTFLTNASDEDWSFLSNPSKRSDLWDPLKYISMGRNGRYLTLSGEVRYRVEGLRIRGVGEIPSRVDGYLLQRYLAGADLHLGPRLRLFFEFQSGIINGKLGTPRATDRDTADLHQAFLEWRQPLKGKQVFGLKAGRQELAIGSSRLISASPGMNVKRSFDGIVLYYRSDAWRIYGTFAKLVSIAKGAFDDRPDHEQTFWGVAASRKSTRLKQGELGIYYLNVDRASAIYNQGVGRDQRQTAGMKWSGKGSRFDLDYDAILQWGAFRGAAVRAWAFSTETGYRLVGTHGKPRFALRADIASGDRDRSDPKLQSFNPLFPGNSYSGQVGLLGPTNLTDLTPAVTFVVRKNLVLGFEAPSYWRTSTGDGVYSPDLRLLLPAAVGPGKYAGTNPGFIGFWQVTRHVMLSGAITRFLSGALLQKTFVANGFGFYSATIVYRF